MRETALRQLRSAALVGILLLSVECGWAADGNQATSGVVPVISGQNEFVYRYRDWEGDHDSDFYDYWYLRARDLFDGMADGYWSGRLHKDLDGTSSSLADDIFSSIEDVVDDGWETQTYQLWADVHTPDKQFGARIGRQYVDDAGWLHIDGVDLRGFEREAVSGHVFVGRPVSYYSGTSDDWAYGASLTAHPWYGNRSRLTFLRYEDDSLDENDDWYSLDVWQRISEEWRTRGRLSFVDDRFQTAGGDLIYYNLAGDLDIFLQAYYWGGLEQESRQFSPLFTVLGELEPYLLVSARLNKALTDWLTVSPGAVGRFVKAEKRDVRNRQYGHYDLSFILEPHDHVTLSISGEYWDTSGDDEFWGITGEVRYRPSKLWEAAIGTGYLDYEYHYQLFPDLSYSVEAGDVVASEGAEVRSSPDVYSVYARAKVNLSRRVWCSLRGEIEDNSLEDDPGYALRTSLGVRF